MVNVTEQALQHLRKFKVKIVNEDLPSYVHFDSSNFDKLVETNPSNPNESNHDDETTIETEPMETNEEVYHDVLIEQCSKIIQSQYSNINKTRYFQLNSSKGQTYSVKKSTMSWAQNKAVIASVNRNYRFKYNNYPDTRRSSNSDSNKIFRNDWICFNDLAYVCRVVDFKKKNINTKSKKVGKAI